MTAGFYAHSLPGKPTSEWEPLEDHLRRGARLAAEPGRFIPHRDRRTRRPSLSALLSQLSTLPNDQHAEDIVEEVRQVFSKGNEFCQKISSKAKTSEELLQQFRTGYQPRIAVTVDMIATGTVDAPLKLAHGSR